MSQGYLQLGARAVFIWYLLAGARGIDMDAHGALTLAHLDGLVHLVLDLQQSHQQGGRSRALRCRQKVPQACGPAFSAKAAQYQTGCRAAPTLAGAVPVLHFACKPSHMQAQC